MNSEHPFRRDAGRQDSGGDETSKHEGKSAETGNNWRNGQHVEYCGSHQYHGGWDPNHIMRFDPNDATW